MEHLNEHVNPNNPGVIENLKKHLIPFTLFMNQKVFHFAFPNCVHREKNEPRNIPSPGLGIGVRFVSGGGFLMKDGLGINHKCEPPGSVCEALILCHISWASHRAV